MKNPKRVEAGKKARIRVKEIYSPDEISAWARKGGQVKVAKGFSTMDKDRLREVSIKGGSK